MIKRDLYLDRFRDFYNIPIIKVLTGMRRSGKSTMLQLIQEDLRNSGAKESQFFMLNMESVEGLTIVKAEDLMSKLNAFFSSLKEGEKGYLFLDEIQLLNGWESVVNACNTSYNADIYITGSNASLLSSDLATLLSGRYVSFQVHPFSFSEFVELYSHLGKSAPDLFLDYVQIGGMPSLKYFNLQVAPSIQSLKDIYNSVILKDVVEYGQIRNTDLLQRIILFVVSNIGNTFSASSINKFFKSENRIVSVDTILSYLALCENAFFIKRVPRQELPGKKLLAVNEKYYIADQGFREALIGNNQAAIQGILENIVYWELVRRGFDVFVGKSGDKEIDFVANKSGETEYYQVTYLLADESTINREFSALSSISDNYRKIVLSMDSLNLSRDGIEHKNIVNWLLE